MNAKVRVLGLLLAVVVFGACDCGDSGLCDDDRPGERGGCCRADGCNAGLTCVESSCRPCGPEGVRCCYTPTSFDGVCDAGLTCVSPAMGAEVCERCGMLGGPCCDGAGTPPCGTGEACIANRCQSAAGLCVAGTTRFDVGVTDENGCGLRVITVVTDTFPNAIDCARTMLNAGERVYETGEGVLTDYQVCVITRMEADRMVTVRAFDDFTARTCACMGQLLGCTVEYRACS